MKAKARKVVWRLLNGCLVRTLTTWTVNAKAAAVGKIRMKRALSMMMHRFWVCSDACFRRLAFCLEVWFWLLLPESQHRRAHASLWCTMQHMTALRQVASFRRWKAFCGRRDQLWRAFSKVSSRWERLSVSMPFESWCVSVFVASQKLKAFQKVINSVCWRMR